MCHVPTTNLRFNILKASANDFPLRLLPTCLSSFICYIPYWARNLIRMIFSCSHV